MRGSRQQFRNALMGYQKDEVEDYIARMESEVDIQTSRLEKSDEQIVGLNSEIEQLKNRIGTERNKNQELIDRNALLTRTVTDLEDQIRSEKTETERWKRKYEELKEKMDSSDINPKTIQDAILNAQRMSEMVIAEANQKADEILKQAKSNLQEQEETGRQIIKQSEEEATRMTETAKKKCEDLQKDYDRILLDVTGFKAEVMRMYRRHMALLASLPEKEMTTIEQKEHYIDAEFEDMEAQENE